jgi:hypothetical protein
MVRGEEEELLRVAHKLHMPPLLLDVHGGEEEEVRALDDKPTTMADDDAVLSLTVDRQ